MTAPHDMPHYVALQKYDLCHHGLGMPWGTKRHVCLFVIHEQKQCNLTAIIPYALYGERQNMYWSMDVSPPPPPPPPPHTHTHTTYTHPPPPTHPSPPPPPHHHHHHHHHLQPQATTHPHTRIHTCTYYDKIIYMYSRMQFKSGTIEYDISYRTPVIEADYQSVWIVRIFFCRKLTALQRHSDIYIYIYI